jgi:hypothetical protein
MRFNKKVKKVAQGGDGGGHAGYRTAFLQEQQHERNQMATQLRYFSHYFSACIRVEDFKNVLLLLKLRSGIPRWQLEGGSRKQASYSEISERCWRHTLQA